MPYIPTKDRPPIWRAAHALQKETGNNIGQLNYAITTLLRATHPKTYSDYNALVGMLECVKLEFYRRAVSLYEDEKVKENGDVYSGYGE